MSTTKHVFRQLLSLGLILSSEATFFYPDAQTSLIEHILVDTHGAFASGFADAITPCTNYVNGLQTLGRETAAQWIRVSFHDFVTANVTAGTGGIDASIGFETLREENSGVAMNDSLSFFRPYVSSRISMADLIALSVSLSVGNCGGPQIPVRGGRIDATEAGETGVPAPDTDLPTTLGYFSRAGFDAADSIGLTACGHTMGSVHHAGFPTVVTNASVTEDNTGGGIHFDSTPAVFDPLVLGEYLDGTGNRGGPLVTSFNVTSRSDLRLYESDNNATMISLRAQGSGFLNTCSVLLSRMLETVPSDVVLSEIIEPMALKPVNATFDFDGHDLIFTGFIRVLSTSYSSSATAALAIGNKKPLILSPESTPGTNVFGTTSFFPFSIPIESPMSFTAFSVEANGAQEVYSVQTSGFVVPSLSSVVTNSAGSVANFTIATWHNRSPPIVAIKAPIGQQGTQGPAIKTFNNLAVTYAGWKAGYSLWTGSLNLGVVATGPVEIALLGSDGQEVDISFF